MSTAKTALLTFLALVAFAGNSLLCRMALLPGDGDAAAIDPVGFTVLRRPRHREVLRLLLRGLEGEKLPTRVVEVDLDGPRVVGAVEVGDAGAGTIYGVTAITG